MLRGKPLSSPAVCNGTIARLTLSAPRACQLMYYLYIRVVILGVLSRYASQYCRYSERTKRRLTASGTTCPKITYDLYVGFWFKPCLSCYSSVWTRSHNLVKHRNIAVNSINNCGAGAEKVCRFVSTRSFDTLRMTKFFICARNENLFGAYL